MALPNGLFLFRCIVDVVLHEPLPAELTEDGEVVPEMGSYMRTFGVTAANAADAVAAVLEEWRPREDQQSPAGSLTGIDTHVIWPDSVDADSIDGELGERGVHFVSGHIFCALNDAEPEDEEEQ
jgi:hypothetical protein